MKLYPARTKSRLYPNRAKVMELYHTRKKVQASIIPEQNVLSCFLPYNNVGLFKLKKKKEEKKGTYV